MVTMDDVARVANVSATTVSHVINKTRKVNPDTERAVREAIESTLYAGDGIARSLRTGSTQTIGLAMSAISNPYFGDVVHALERVATDRGYTLLLTDTHDDPERELRALRDLLSRRVDGVVLAPSASPDAAYAMLTKRRKPLVLIDRVPDEVHKGIDAIGVHNREPTAQLVDHLVRVHGHRRLGMLAPRAGIITTLERVDGFRTGLARNGLDAASAPVEHAGDDDEQTSAALDRMLDSAEPPTALVLGNNMITVGAIRALRSRGITPPEGIATASFDDFPWAESFHPRLSTISQPVDDLGASAIRLLLDRIASPDLAPRHVRLEPEFRIRESCGCSDET